VKLIEEIVNRRSIRDYLPRPVEREKLERIFEAARLAPTARNQQDWRILVVTDPQLKERLADEASPRQPFLKQAPVLLAACASNPSYVMRCGHPAYLIDLAIVLEHVALQAVREGLGTCWIGSFDEGKAREVLRVPAPVRIVELMSLGYHECLPDPRPRKPLPELIQWGAW
jgi:nitroreductase